MSECIDHGKVGNNKGYHIWPRKVPYKGKMAQPMYHIQLFFEHHGYYPENVRHTCDNSRCINIDHLKGGTSKDNNRDTVHSGKHNLLKLSQEEVDEIRYWHKLKPTSNMQRALAIRFNTCFSNIYSIVTYRTRKPHTR